MLDDPRIKTEMQDMKSTVSRIIWRIKKCWGFEAPFCRQIALTAFWHFLNDVNANGCDPVDILRKMKRNSLDRVNRRLFWRLVTRSCREFYAEDNFYIDANPARGTSKRRRIPARQHLTESLFASEGEIPFDPMPYLPEIILGLSSEDQDVVNVLMYEEMTVNEFTKRENLDSRNWYKRRDAVKDRVLIAIRRVERTLFKAPKVLDNVEKVFSNEMNSDESPVPKG